MKRRLIAVVWGSAILCTLIFQSSLGDPIRAVSIDALVWLRDCVPAHGQHAKDPAVVIIAVDEKTYQTPPFRGTPRVAWSNYLAKVIEAILAADATMIGFDIVLSTSLDSRLPGIDRKLLEALHRGSLENRILLGEVLHGRSRIQPYLGYRAVVDFEKNIRPLDVSVDPDGVIRRMPMFVHAPFADGGSGAIPSMALELANRSRVSGAGQHDGHLGKRARASLLDFRPAHQSEGTIINLRRSNIDIPTYTLADLYHCAQADDEAYFANHFAGKIVLIGSALDVEDQVLSSARFILPALRPDLTESCTMSNANDAPAISSGPTMPGVYLHAAMVQNLLDGDVIQTFSPVSHAILTVLAVGSLMMAGISFHPIASLSLVGLTNVALTAGSTLAFASNILIFFLVPAAGSVIGYAGGLSLRLLILERRRRRIRDAFNHLLPASVVEQLIDRNEVPIGGGKLTTCTVLLTDLENYTGLAEQMKPDDLVEVLNRVNQALGEVIERHGGIVSWHAGDSLLALFGAPIECTNHAEQGVKAALDSCLAVQRLNSPDLLARGTKLRLRVGVSTGEMLVGYIGSNRQLTYSAIGDHVNVASRLEAMNKIYNTSILVNETTYVSAQGEFEWRRIDNALVKGRKKSVNIFEPKWKRMISVPIGNG